MASSFSRPRISSSNLAVFCRIYSLCFSYYITIASSLLTLALTASLSAFNTAHFSPIALILPSCDPISLLRAFIFLLVLIMLF